MGRPTNTQFALAVHALTLLYAAPRHLQSSEILATSAGSNPVHIRRVLGRLRGAGLVASRPGVNGGWQAIRDPSEVTLADVWRAVHGDDHLLGLHEANPACEVGQRIHSELNDVDRRAASAVEQELGRTTLTELVRSACRARPSDALSSLSPAS